VFAAKVHRPNDGREIYNGSFLRKKENNTLRLIGDCRRTNRYFRSPTSIDLVTGEGFSGIELDDSALEHELFIATGDVDNCFHRMRLTGWLRHYFCWPPIAASKLGITCLGGVNLLPTDPVYPHALVPANGI
jgi:hypothetical protein